MDGSRNLDVATIEVGGVSVVNSARTITGAAYKLGSTTVIDAARNIDARTLEVGGVTVVNTSRNVTANIGDFTQLRINGQPVVSGNSGLDTLSCAGQGIPVFNGSTWACSTSPTISVLGADAELSVRADSSHIATISALGTSGQGTGRFYAGQTQAHGGGFLYNGDDTPDITGVADRITMYRRNNGTDSAVFDFPYGSSNVQFYGNIDTNGIADTGSLRISGTEVIDGSRNLDVASVEVGGVSVVNSSRNVTGTSFKIGSSTVIDGSRNVDGRTLEIGGTTVVDTSRNVTANIGDFTQLRINGQAVVPGDSGLDTLSCNGQGIPQYNGSTWACSTSPTLSTTGGDSILTVAAGNADEAIVQAVGTSGQGTGRFYAGQSATHGGGFLYNGDDSPNIIGNTDRITFYRRTNGTDTAVFDFPHSNNNVQFYGNVDTNGISDVGSLRVLGNTVIDGSRNITAGNITAGTTSVGTLTAGTTTVSSLKVGGTTVVDSNRVVSGTSFRLGTSTFLTSANNLSVDNADVDSITRNNVTVMDTLGNITGLSLNTTGTTTSGAYRIGGTTVINGSRNVTANNLTASGSTTSGSYKVGGNTVIDGSRNVTGAIGNFSELRVNGTQIINGSGVVDGSLDTLNCNNKGIPYYNGSSWSCSTTPVISRTGQDTSLTVRADNTHVATIAAVGNGTEGAGRFYAGEDDAVGGGFFFNGNDSPNLVGGSNNLTFFRRNGGFDTEVFHFNFASSDVHFNGGLTTSGVSTFGHNVTVNGHSTVNGNSTISGNLTAGGTANLNGNVNVDDNLVVDGFSTLTGNTLVGGTLTVNNVSNFNGPLDIFNDVEVYDEVQIYDNLSVSGLISTPAPLAVYTGANVSSATSWNCKWNTTTKASGLVTRLSNNYQFRLNEPGWYRVDLRLLLNSVGGNNQYYYVKAYKNGAEYMVLGRYNTHDDPGTSNNPGGSGSSPYLNDSFVIYSDGNDTFRIHGNSTSDIFNISSAQAYNMLAIEYIGT